MRSSPTNNTHNFTPISSWRRFHRNHSKTIIYIYVRTIVNTALLANANNSRTLVKHTHDRKFVRYRCSATLQIARSNRQQSNRRTRPTHLQHVRNKRLDRIVTKSSAQRERQKKLQSKPIFIVFLASNIPPSATSRSYNVQTTWVASCRCDACWLLNDHSLRRFSVIVLGCSRVRNNNERYICFNRSVLSLCGLLRLCQIGNHVLGGNHGSTFCYHNHTPTQPTRRQPGKFDKTTGTQYEGENKNDDITTLKFNCSLVDTKLTQWCNVHFIAYI